jgi:hypothetical protein
MKPLKQKKEEKEHNKNGSGQPKPLDLIHLGLAYVFAS